MLPELSPANPLERLSPLEEAVPLEKAVPPELTPDATPLAEVPPGSPAHAQTRQQAAARHAERRVDAHSE